MARAKKLDHEDLVTQYFKHIHDLRNGKEDAVDRLVEMWDEDGVFEFAGAPPVTGTFKGRNAIHTLYKNRLRANGMPLTLQVDGKGRKAAATRDAALGLVETDVRRMRTVGVKGNGKPQRVAVAWTTTIGTADKRGFQVAGNHAFIFTDGKISSLKVVVSPKADDKEGFTLEGLSVDDIGRLSLAAWAVV